MNYTQLLRRKLFLIQSVVLVLFGLTVVASVSVVIYQHLVADFERAFVSGAISKSDAVSQWLVRAEDLARQVTSRSRLRQDLQRYNNNALGLDELIRVSRPKLQDAIRSSHEIEGITRLAASGDMIVQLGIAPPEASRHVSLPIQNALVDGSIFRIDGSDYYWVRAPIVDRQEKVVGADIVVLSIFRLVQSLQAAMAAPADEPGWGLFLISRNNPAVLISHTVGARFSDPKTIDALAKDASLVGAGNSEKRFMRDGLFSVAVPVKNSNWVVMASMEHDKLVIPILDELAELLPLVMGLYAICLVAYWVALRPLAKRILLEHHELQSEIDAKTAALQKELTARIKAELEKDQVIDELQQALKQVKQLGGLLPICASCKKIRNDQGYWQQVEEYIRTHSGVEFTHGLCPDCRKKLYPEVFND